MSAFAKERNGSTIGLLNDLRPEPLPADDSRFVKEMSVWSDPWERRRWADTSVGSTFQQFDSQRIPFNAGEFFAF
jgi:hypothetical protein